MTECYQLVETFTKSQRVNRDAPVLLTPGNLTETHPPVMSDGAIVIINKTYDHLDCRHIRHIFAIQHPLDLIRPTPDALPSQVTDDLV
jgi:hypothetical protein